MNIHVRTLEASVEKMPAPHSLLSADWTKYHDGNGEIAITFFDGSCKKYTLRNHQLVSVTAAGNNSKYL